MDKNNPKCIALLLPLIFSSLLSCRAPKDLEYKDYRNFSIEALGFTNSHIRLELEYFNPNNFGLQLKRSDVDVFINNTLLGHSSSDTLIQIPRRNSFILPIKFDVDMQNIFKNAWNSMPGHEVTVKVVGNVKVGKANVFMSMPVNYEGKQTFSIFQ